MKLTEFLKRDLIVSNVTAKDKVEAISELTDRICSAFSGIAPKKLKDLILERERLSSTGIGSGIAIPHAKLEGIDKHIILFARSIQGIPFDSIDDKPVHLIFLIVGSLQSSETHLKALARISKFLHDTSFREQLMMAKNEEDLFEAIVKKDEQY